MRSFIPAKVGDIVEFEISDCVWVQRKREAVAGWEEEQIAYWKDSLHFIDQSGVTHRLPVDEFTHSVDPAVHTCKRLVYPLRDGDIGADDLARILNLGIPFLAHPHRAELSHKNPNYDLKAAKALYQTILGLPCRGAVQPQPDRVTAPAM